MAMLSRHIRVIGVVVALLTLSSCSQEKAPQSHSAVSDAVIAGQDLSKNQVLTEVSSEEKNHQWNLLRFLNCRPNLKRACPTAISEKKLSAVTGNQL